MRLGKRMVSAPRAVGSKVPKDNEAKDDEKVEDGEE